MHLELCLVVSGFSYANCEGYEALCLLSNSCQLFFGEQVNYLMVCIELVIFRKSARNFNAPMARAAKLTIAEVSSIHEFKALKRYLVGGG